MDALLRTLQSILDEVDGKADASCEPGDERETPNDYMRIEMAAEEAMEEAKRMVAKLSDGTSRWIPVSERLPDQRRRSVLVHCAERGNTYTAYLDEGEATAIDPFWQPWRHFGGDGGEVFGVTHWMPLPEAPK